MKRKRLTVAQAAKKIDVTEMTVYRAVRSGRIDADTAISARGCTVVLGIEDNAKLAALGKQARERRLYAGKAHGRR